MNTVKSLKGAKAVGNTIIVEMLKKQEAAGTKILVGEGLSADEAPQAFILDIGPHVDEQFGFKVGDRVIVQGNCVPLPKKCNLTDNGRDWMVVDTHVIKAVLLQD